MRPFVITPTDFCKVEWVANFSARSACASPELVIAIHRSISSSRRTIVARRSVLAVFATSSALPPLEHGGSIADVALNASCVWEN